MTPLGTVLLRQIAANGPITLADYMAECLMHPHFGYYSTRDPFGAAGDFTTAPEISQMFGELLGLWLAQCWLDRGSPAPFTLAELGPGRGTLMADVLRATARVPGFHAGAEIHLVETSAALRARQRQSLGARPVQWHDAPTTLPDQPLFLLANEFFDALPIRQFTRESDGWSETMVGQSDGKLVFGRGKSEFLAAADHRLRDTRPGDVVEICPVAVPIMQAISTRIQAFGGIALIIDYGGWHSLGDTFQALQAHRFADPLAAPGSADLTAHVDFAALAAQAPAWAYATQGDLLTRLGIAARADRLAQNLAGEALLRHRAATRRLTAPEEMGQLFKALAVFAERSPRPPGFA